jgi:hypothetical protein
VIAHGTDLVDAAGWPGARCAMRALQVTVTLQRFGIEKSLVLCPVDTLTSSIVDLSFPRVVAARGISFFCHAPHALAELIDLTCDPSSTGDPKKPAHYQIAAIEPIESRGIPCAPDKADAQK